MDSRSKGDPILNEWHSLRNLSWSLQIYAGENEGQFPELLEDVESIPGQWRYFPGFSSVDPPDTILVASSKTFPGADGTHLIGNGPHRMVLSLGGRRFWLKETDYQACIKEQQ
jgi:hypothetical protein